MKKTVNELLRQENDLSVNRTYKSIKSKRLQLQRERTGLQAKMLHVRLNEILCIPRAILCVLV